MKNLILLGLGLSCYITSYSQNYQYDISIVEIKNAADAKSITDPIIREFFSNQENKRSTEVHFNDETDIFTIISRKLSDEQALNARLQEYNYHLKSFNTLNL